MNIWTLDYEMLLAKIRLNSIIMSNHHKDIRNLHDGFQLNESLSNDKSKVFVNPDKNK